MIIIGRCMIRVKENWVSRLQLNYALLFSLTLPIYMFEEPYNIENL